MKPLLSPFFNVLAGFNGRHNAPAFGDHAQNWWDSEGPMAPLHRINPQRMAYVKDVLCAHFSRDATARLPLKGLTILDIGCGGGLVTEALTRLGASVTGIDASAELITVAKEHAAEQNLQITYEAVFSDVLVKRKKIYDAVLALEVIEHVANPSALLHDMKKLIQPKGVAIVSTLNRTPASFMGGIVAAEYLLRWVPKGTHQWQSFIKPSELVALAVENKLRATATMGLHYNLLSKDFSLQADKMDINYFMVLQHG
jgi:2-polyprenyl-6-hydroxyphenyl methylase/3-demethylubiquinone-9 3-methyltransferase